jgi:hypothetical protein
MTSSTNKVSLENYLMTNDKSITSYLAIITITFSAHSVMQFNGATNYVIQVLSFVVIYLVLLRNLWLFNKIGYKNASLGLLLVWLLSTIVVIPFSVYFFSPAWIMYNHFPIPVQFLIALSVLINVLLDVGFITLIRYLHKKYNDLLSFLKPYIEMVTSDR